MEIDRFNHTIKRTGISAKSPLGKIIQRHQDIFMAHQWDIGYTKLIKHKILPTGGPIMLKPRRQPVHLEGKI